MPRPGTRVLVVSLALCVAAQARVLALQQTPTSQPSPAQPAAPPDNSLWTWRVPLEEPLITDRPDFTESTEAVPRGHVQFEAGYTFTLDREGSQRTRAHTAPEGLLRVGLAEHFELRFGWEGYTWTERLFRSETRAGRSVGREEWDQGAADISFGAKYKFCDQEGLRPHFGVIGEFTVPSGSTDSSSGVVDPELKLLWSYDLSERLALSGNVNLAAPTEDFHRFFQTAASLSLARSWTDWLGSYVEYYGFYPNTRYGDCAHTLNGGLTFPLTRDFQIDVRAGAGLNEEADDFFAGIGFAWRW